MHGYLYHTLIDDVNHLLLGGLTYKVTCLQNVSRVLVTITSQTSDMLTGFILARQDMSNPDLSGYLVAV